MGRRSSARPRGEAAHAGAARRAATGGGVEPKDVRRVGVVGAGIMGSGIVEVVARAGAEVVYVEAGPELVRRGRERIERSIGTAVDRGKLEEANAHAALGRVRGESDLGALADSDLMIEAATELVEA